MGEHEVRLDSLNLVAQDSDATIAFYRHLGLTITDDMIWRTESGAHHTGSVRAGSEMDLDIDSAALAEIYNDGYQRSPDPGTILGFRVGSREAVDELHGKLVAAGYESRQEPFDAFWGARYAIVADPDGRDVGLMSPRHPKQGGPPPDL